MDFPVATSKKNLDDRQKNAVGNDYCLLSSSRVGRASFRYSGPIAGCLAQVRQSQCSFVQGAFLMKEPENGNPAAAATALLGGGLAVFLCCLFCCCIGPCWLLLFIFLALILNIFSAIRLIISFLVSGSNYHSNICTCSVC